MQVGNGNKVLSCFLCKLYYNGNEVITLTNKIQINLRVEEELLNKLDKTANEENRSRNNLIEHILKEYFNNLNR